MNRIIGSKIRSIRTIKDINQEYMALKMGISQNAYSKIERGETSIDDNKLSSISVILGVSKEEILNYTEENYIRSRSLLNIEETLKILCSDIREIKQKLNI
jgi:transcriptional regulator with XRE-family HTH domain